MTNCCEPLAFTRGATFDYSGAATLNGAAFNFTGWPVPTCQIRKLDSAGRPSALVADLTCEWLNAATGAIRIYSATSTAAWTLGKAALDVRFTDTLGNVVQTSLSEIEIVESATRGGGCSVSNIVLTLAPTRSIALSLTAPAQAAIEFAAPSAAMTLQLAPFFKGDKGDKGDAGGTYSHTQAIALPVWTVPHNLGRHPSVTATDNLGNVIFGDVSYVDANIVQITHGNALAGFAYCN